MNKILLSIYIYSKEYFIHSLNDLPTLNVVVFEYDYLKLSSGRVNYYLSIYQCSYYYILLISTFSESSITHLIVNTFLYCSACRFSSSFFLFKRLYFTYETDKMKLSFFQATVVSILLCGCTTWTLTKRMEKNLDGNYTRMLRAILNKYWRQHPTKQQLKGHLPPITKTIKVRRTRHAGHSWRRGNGLIRDVLQWTPSHGHARAGRLARTHIQQLCEETGGSPDDLPKAMKDREQWRERVRDNRAARHDDDEFHISFFSSLLSNTRCIR